MASTTGRGQNLSWPFSEIIALAGKLEAEAAQIQRDTRDIGWTPRAGGPPG
jgi:hypothetical protein